MNWLVLRTSIMCPDAVSHIPHDVSSLLEGENDALFLVGLNFGEDVYVNHMFEQRAIAHLAEG
jgi:hypothetical protein